MEDIKYNKPVLPNAPLLPRTFYARHGLQVARDLLGMRLVRVENSRRLAGVITETEAYEGEEDQACHARFGRTPRNAIMYGPPGYAYIYFTYGMHWLLNAVTEPEPTPAAVLIRAIRPVEGLDVIAARRNSQPQSAWTDGPAKLTFALNIAKALNGADLCDLHSALFIEQDQPVPDAQVVQTARVGLFHTPEPWKSIPWRFVVKDEASRAKSPGRKAD
jgi:DNA-3-methyladenine glycosylase